MHRLRVQIHPLRNGTHRQAQVRESVDRDPPACLVPVDSFHGAHVSPELNVHVGFRHCREPDADDRAIWWSRRGLWWSRRIADRHLELELGLGWRVRRDVRGAARGA